MRSVLLAAIVSILLTSSGANAALTLTNGGLWSIETRAKVVACLAGRCASDQERQTDEYDLPAGTVVEIYLQVLSCLPLSAADYCDLAPRRKGKFKLVGCDKPTLQSLLESCSPYPRFRLRRVGGFERLAGDGNSFKWKSAVAFTVRASGHTVAVRVIATVTGTLLASGALSGDASPAMLEFAPVTTDLLDGLIGQVARP